MTIGTRDPIPKPDPVPKYLRYFLFFLALIAGILALILSLRLLLTPEQFQELLDEMLLLNATLWGATVILLWIGTRDPEEDDPPVPKEDDKKGEETGNG
jgi:hypothetical protein